MRTAADAQQDRAATVSPRAVKCFGVVGRRLLTAAGKYRAVREVLSRQQPPLPGLPAAFALRITERYGPPFNRQSFAAVTDFDGFVVGPAEVVVALSAAEPFPGTEKYILSRLLRRAKISAKLL
jgi:hypothetical protein